MYREFIAKDTQGKNRPFIESTCSICGNNYIRQKRHYNEYNTCSRGCTRIAKGETVQVTCAHCGIAFNKAKSKLLGSKSGLYFCCREHKDLGQSYIKEIQPDHYGTGTGKSGYRYKAFDLLEHKCSVCGYYENQAALVVHHKDRDRDNNDFSNLQILCANSTQ